MNALDKLRKNGIDLSLADITAIAEKYGIKTISIFGSSIRADFTPESDIDLVIKFHDSANISLLDIIDIEKHFETITKRPVDIVEPDGLKNPYRKKTILETMEPLYVA